MIIIYYDFEQTQHIKLDKYTWVASQVSDYVPLRQHLHQILNDADHNYVIYIQSRILARWLNDLRDYGPSVIRWEEVNLHKQFQQKFGFLLPPELDERAIRDLHLLDLPLPDDLALSDPIGWMLGQCIHRVWTYKRPYEGHLADLASWALEVKQLPQALLPLLRKRLRQWKEIDARYQIFLERSWQGAGEWVLLRWALRSYPMQFQLRGQLDAVPLEDCRRYPDHCRDLLNKRAAELRNFWTSWLATSTPLDMKLVIQSMSGLADVELDVFEKWVRENVSDLTLPLLVSARERFSLLPQSKTILTRLEQLLPPTLPDTPDIAWSVEEWLYWATEKYIPYFGWVIRNQQQRDTQMELAGRFADWLVATYSQLLFDCNASFITNQKHQILEVFSAKRADVVLWFIIDGLTWWQGKKLSNICADQGLGIRQIHPMLSALPSITSISKRALVQGSLEPTLTTQPIAQLLEGLLSRDIPNAHLYTQYHEMKMAMRTDLKSGLYVLFYNAIDHQSHESRSFTDDESIDGHLNLIAHLVEEGFQQCLKQGLMTTAFISSDHGSTLLPSPSAVLPVPNFAHAVEGEDTLEDVVPDKGQKMYQKTRVCAIEREPGESSLRQAEQDWYLLRKNIFNLPQDFLIPRGYAAVARRPRGWTHGGATPEETVTAFIELQSSPLQITAPTIDIEGYLLPHRITSLKVRLVNPNPVPLKKVQISLLDTPGHVGLDIVQADSVFAYEIEGPAATSKGSTQILQWFLSCEVNGQARSFKGDIEVPIRRLQVSAVDELFEDML